MNTARSQFSHDGCVTGENHSQVAIHQRESQPGSSSCVSLRRVEVGLSARGPHGTIV